MPDSSIDAVIEEKGMSETNSKSKKEKHLLKIDKNDLEVKPLNFSLMSPSLS